MEEHIKNFLTKYNLNISNQKVVVAVSTGVDSMTLLNLLEKLDCIIIVAHVNHGVREQSKDEEKFISEYCKSHHLKLYVSHVLPNQFPNNFQEEARKFRKHFFEEVLAKEEAKYLFLAHHLNDDIETSIMRIIRGSNLKGYSGIEEYIEKDHYVILRPLLKVLKQDLISYANKHHLVYFNDYTNELDHYTRNRIRHHIVPELFKENENFHEKFLEFKEALKEASDLINHYCYDFINNHVTKLNNGYNFKSDKFLSLSSYLQEEILFTLLKPYNLSKDNIIEIIKLIISNKKNLKINYKGIGFVKEYNDIYLYFNDVTDYDVYIVIDSIGEYPIDENRTLVVSKKIDNSVTNLKKVWYNSNKLPLIARSKKDGDKITFSYGTKKVSKLLIDKKVGITKREKVIVLEKDQDILAVLGYGKSELLKSIKDCDIILELKENDDDY